MEILEDILAEVKKQETILQQLGDKIHALEKKESSSKPSINLNSSLVADKIWTKLGAKAEEFGRQAKQLETVASKIPSEIHNTWGVNTSTKIWGAVMFLILLVGFWIGYLFAPEVVEDYKRIQVENELQNREEQIQTFRDKNPDTAKKYFGE